MALYVTELCSVALLEERHLQQPEMMMEVACTREAIDVAIARGLARVEAGAQGGHKLARGYLPTETHSLHWIADRGFADAVARYLEEERRAIGQDIEILTAYGPFRKEIREEQE